MPLDAITLSAVTEELSPLTGMRAEKIHQPARDEVVLTLRGGGARLLLSANTARPRLHLLDRARENPGEPPMFCMLLRKHLTGGRLTGIAQVPAERVVRLSFDVLDEMGDPGRRALVLEAMGRHSNLILLDGEDRILGALRRVDAEMSERRQVLPGLFYRLPPPQEKRNYTDVSREALCGLLSAAPPDVQAADWLLNTFAGLSPLLCRELAFRAGSGTETRLSELEPDALAREWDFLCRTTAEKSFSPILLVREGKAVDFSCIPILQYGPGTELCRAESFSALLEAFYAARDRREQMRVRGAELYRAAVSARDRAARKLEVRRRELSAARERESWRRAGELITANLYRLERGMTEFHTADYYDPEAREVSVALDPLLTPQQNAAMYFKKYNKAKRAEEFLSGETAGGEEELLYLESVLEALSRAERERDLRELREELEQGGYLRRRNDRKKQRAQTVSAPMAFRSTAGIPILVGRNNMQNDLLTLKTARRDELWFHAQKIPGAHVILRTGGAAADEGSVREAALLAAYFSKGRESQNVPVDCAPVKRVKKPSGARPGMVIYTEHRTLYVTPDAGAAERLRAEE